MDNQRLTALLEELCTAVANLEKGAVPADNLLAVLRVVRKEVPYCRVLLHLAQRHWDSFQRLVLADCCAGEPLVRAQDEYPCTAPCAHYAKQGRIDLLFETAGHVVAMEVKIGAGEQENQLIRYYKELEKRYTHLRQKQIHLFYLTLNGKEATTHRCDRYRPAVCEGECCTEYTPLSFIGDIYDWLLPLTREDGVAQQFLEVLEMEKNRTGQYVELLEQSPEYLQAVRELHEALPALWEKIRDRFLVQLAELLCRDYGFCPAQAGHAHGKEVWAYALEKDGRPLTLCYETNFFFRSGERWAFPGHEEGAHQKINLKTFDPTNDPVVAWYYGQDDRLLTRLADSGMAFFRQLS